MNVLMIVSDTVRHDYFGINGGRVRTPNLDALARRSVYFRSAYANSFPTLPTRADYLTGQYAFTDIGWGPLPRTAVSFPQLLVERGVTTVGVVDTPYYVHNGYNYDRGFEYFYDLQSQWNVMRTLWADARENLFRVRFGGHVEPFHPASEYDYCAPQTIATAERALEHLVDKRFFLLVDVWDPHEPWNPPSYYAKAYKADYDGRVVDAPYGPYADCGLTEDDLETAIACYCGELEMVDRWIGRLLERLESLRLAEETAVIFTSDHGMYLGEYGLLGKMILEQEAYSWLRSPLYPEVANIPLMIRVPGVAPRTEDRVVASAINIAPTVLDVFGLEKPEHMLGRSLLPLVRSADEQADGLAVTALPFFAFDSAVYGDHGRLAAVRFVDDNPRGVGEWQPITVTTDDWMLLFARWEDPIELYAINGNDHRSGLGPNMAGEQPDVVKDLHARMIAELRRAGTSEEAIADRS